MAANGTAQRRGNLIPEGKELSFGRSVRSPAPPETVYDVLADLPSHLEWGGNRSKKKNYRLTSLSHADGPAGRGTEFSSTGVAPDGAFRDRSVVTDASRPATFEFVTEAHVTPKNGDPADWTVVHRYEIRPDGTGSRIVYRARITRATGLPGANRLLLVPVVGALLAKMAGAMAKSGLTNLSEMAGARSRKR